MSDILMGRWDCAACEARGILGDVYRCAACGSARPEDVVFYLPEDAEVVTDEAGIAAAQAGADWQCEYCDNWVPATVTECPSCAGGDAATGRRQEQSEFASRAAVPTSATRQQPAAATEPAAGGGAAASPGSGAGGLLKTVFGGCFLLVLSCCVLGGLFGGRGDEVPVTVVGHTWERTCQTEEQARGQCREHPDDSA